MSKTHGTVRTMKYAIYAFTSRTLLLLGIIGLIAGCGKKEDENSTESDQAEKVEKKTEKEPTAAQEDKAPVTVAPDKEKTEKTTKAPPPRRPLKLEEFTPKHLEGMIVRVFRRSLTTAVITVQQERLTDEESAIERESKLIARGWKPWPPRAAPELTGQVAQIEPASKDCPFLMRTKAIPSHGLETPKYEISCFRTVQLMEDALDIQEKIELVYEQARPCRELVGRPPADDKLRHKRLRKQCSRFGIKFDPYGKII